MRVERIEATDIHRVWPDVEGLFEEACDCSGGRYETRHTRDFFDRCIWQLWCLFDDDGKIPFVAATELITYPTGLKSLGWRIGTGTAGIENAALIASHILSEARKQGCSISDGCFRKGWRKVVPFKSWHHTHEFLEIRL